jgi:menaquinol-cytochrome c reductase iron-sulfur subunit
MTEQISSNPEEMDRRKFLSGVIGVVAGTVGVVVGLPAIGYLISPGVKQQNADKWLTLGPISDLTPGVPTGYPYSRTVKDGWVESSQSGVAYAITHDSQSVRVLSDVCPHLSCRVAWHDQNAHFICPCHDAIFTADGEVVSGPPPRPMYEFPSKVENGQIMILVEA